MHYFKPPHSSLKLSTPESRPSDWSSSLVRSSALGLAFLAFAACSSSSSSSGGGGGGGGGGNGNQPPEFDAKVSVSRSENSPINIALNATDPDNDPITFSIADTGDGQWFEIGPDGRSLRNKRILDFEMPLDENGDNDYSITVVVSDGRASTSQVFPSALSMYRTAHCQQQGSLRLSGRMPGMMHLTHCPSMTLMGMDKMTC